jgi:hypothetical protein
VGLDDAVRLHLEHAGDLSRDDRHQRRHTRCGQRPVGPLDIIGVLGPALCREEGDQPAEVRAPERLDRGLDHATSGNDQIQPDCRAMRIASMRLRASSFEIAFER